MCELKEATRSCLQGQCCPRDQMGRELLLRPAVQPKPTLHPGGGGHEARVDNGLKLSIVGGGRGAGAP